MKVNCVMCDKEIDIKENEYVCGVSAGERWCVECADEERKK